MDGYEDGFFIFPTILDGLDPKGEIARTEIFGPVLSLMHANSVDEAIQLVNDRTFGNMACIFTSSGATARQFRYEVTAGNVGINIGVAAPMAFFPFSGWRDSFFGDPWPITAICVDSSPTREADSPPIGPVGLSLWTMPL